MKKSSFLFRLNSLLAIVLITFACTPDETVDNTVRRIYENGVETYEWNGETLAMEFPEAATEEARQFVINLFDGQYDYTRVYEQETDLEKTLAASFGELLHKEAVPVGNEFITGQVDQLVTYRFTGVSITYLITSQGKKVFEKLEITGETRRPLVYGIKTGLQAEALIARLGQPVSRQKNKLYYGHMDDAGLYYEAQVTLKDQRINSISLRIAGGV